MALSLALVSKKGHVDYHIIPVEYLISINSSPTVFGQLSDGLLGLSPFQQESAADAKLRSILQETSRQILEVAQNQALDADRKQDINNFKEESKTLREFFYGNYITDKRTAVERWNILQSCAAVACAPFT